MGCWSSGTTEYEAGLAKPFDSSSAGGNVGRSTEVISCSSHNRAWEVTTKHTLSLPEQEPIITPCSEEAQGRERWGQQRSHKTHCRPDGGADRKAREERWGNVREGQDWGMWGLFLKKQAGCHRKQVNLRRSFRERLQVETQPEEQERCRGGTEAVACPKMLPSVSSLAFISLNHVLTYKNTPAENSGQRTFQTQFRKTQLQKGGESLAGPSKVS